MTSGVPGDLIDREAAPGMHLARYTALHRSATTTLPEGDCPMFAPTIFENGV